jgi:hypothetical protein
MATNRKSVVAANIGSPPDRTPRLALSRMEKVRRHLVSNARVRDVWDMRLRQSERELVLELAGIPRDRVFIERGRLRKWLGFEYQEMSRIFIALRDLVTLGNEAEYALGYRRRNGSHSNHQEADL